MVRDGMLPAAQFLIVVVSGTICGVPKGRVSLVNVCVTPVEGSNNSSVGVTGQVENGKAGIIGALPAGIGPLTIGLLFTTPRISRRRAAVAAGKSESFSVSDAAVPAARLLTSSDFSTLSCAS